MASGISDIINKIEWSLKSPALWTGCTGIVTGAMLTALFSNRGSSESAEPASAKGGFRYQSLIIPLVFYGFQAYLIRTELSKLRPYEWATSLAALGLGTLVNAAAGIDATWVVESSDKDSTEQLKEDLKTILQLGIEEIKELLPKKNEQKNLYEFDPNESNLDDTFDGKERVEDREDQGEFEQVGNNETDLNDVSNVVDTSVLNLSEKLVVNERKE